MEAINYDKYSSMDDFKLVDEMNKLSNVAIPNAIESIRNAKILHDTVCEVDEMQSVVEKYLGL